MTFGLRTVRIPLALLAVSGVASLALSVSLTAVSAAQPRTAQHTSAPCYNYCPASRNLLITDQFNNRVIEVNTRTNKIVWSFGSNDPTACNPGPGTVIGPNDAERLSGGDTLIAGTGIPVGGSPADPSLACADNRVIVVNHAGTIIWQYGQAGVSGSADNQLNVPVFAIQLPNRNIMIVDQANNRVIVVSRFSRHVIWSYGPTSGRGALNNPNSAELLPNGHVLIADENNNRIIEITQAGKIVWQYGSGNPSVTTPLQTAAFASRLSNGDTLITDAGHSRVLEVTRNKHLVWQYFTNSGQGSNAAPLPTNAVRLSARCAQTESRHSCPAAFGNDTVIADQYNHRVIIVSQKGKIRYQFGTTNIFGNGNGQLDGPYTAYAVGDYTGQTPPPSRF
jgi:hypothetical protein